MTEATDTSDLNVLTFGEGTDKPALIFVHGMAGSAGLWGLYYAFWLMRRYRIVAYDLRGHGLSEATSQGYALADQAEDLERVRRHWVGGPATVVGYSYGGHIATQWARTYPEHARGLVVLDSPPLPVDERAIDDMLDGLSQVLGGDFEPEGGFLDSIKDSLRGDIESQRRQVRRFKSRLDALHDTRFRAEVLADEPFGDDDFRAIQCPTQLIYSTGDGNRAYAEHQQRLIPDCGLAMVEAGHDLVMTHPAEVRRLLEVFMARLAAHPPIVTDRR
ncbi:alpha/beta fold hydrolase [Saccharospirillum salsuginis]|uniref:AB hydrolase-1 domain-containing protein n=1 Tax=Saccharospirillum salsuginis TaxID=418750 RepID=A0A918KP12_9GAMM|nr:alpha/beta hydrolase [Saccharospirillum salsuginis]GGX67918.1 hypothetical protein GCM10007392_39530 [Saccharospirillum salsuginis]